ncbi:NMRAL1 protein [Colletotrichum higginsianum]|nr:NMRAL1 protein [Colletotrichum higginsianum]
MPDTAPIPLFDTANTGIWVKAIVRKRDQLLGKRVFGATKYTTPNEILEAFKQTFPKAGEKATFFRLPDEVFAAGIKEAMGVPDWVAEEMLENMQLIYDGGYYGFEPLDESLAILEDKPTTCLEFIRNSPAFKDLQ